MNPMNLHHDISLPSLHGKPGTGCFSKNECEWNKNSVKTKQVKYSWCSQHHLGVFWPDPSPLQVRTTCRAIALITINCCGVSCFRLQLQRCLPSHNPVTHSPCCGQSPVTTFTWYHSQKHGVKHQISALQWKHTRTRAAGTTNMSD